MKRCPECRRYYYDDDDRFCAECGKPLRNARCAKMTQQVRFFLTSAPNVIGQIALTVAVIALMVIFILAVWLIQGMAVSELLTWRSILYAVANVALFFVGPLIAIILCIIFAAVLPLFFLAGICGVVLTVVLVLFLVGRASVRSPAHALIIACCVTTLLVVWRKTRSLRGRGIRHKLHSQ